MKEMLDRAIKKAVEQGWEGPLNIGYYLTIGGIKLNVGFVDDPTVPIERIIFNHDFAKALWGEDVTWLPGNAGAEGLPVWQHHLQSMVIADDPIKYLGENI